VDPARGAAGLHDDLVDARRGKQVLDVVILGLDRFEALFLGGGFEETGNGGELAKVDCECHHGVDSVVGGVNVLMSVDCDRSRDRDHRLVSRFFQQTRL